MSRAGWQTVRDQGVGDTHPKVPGGVLTMNGTQQQAKTMALRFILKFTCMLATGLPQPFVSMETSYDATEEDAG